MVRKKQNKNDDVIKIIKKKRTLQTIISDPYKNSKPSQVTDVYWIYAENNVVSYPEDTERSGKWLIFVPNDKIDEIWMTIKKATENGLLVKASKVATSKPNPNAPTSKDKVICVYTYDCEDKKDVMRIRDGLRKIGFISKIPYKTDKATLENKYSVKGDTRISTYYE